MNRIEAEEVDADLFGLQPDDLETLFQNALGELRAPERPGSGVEEHVLADEALHAADGYLQLGVRGLPPIFVTRTRSGPICSRCACVKSTTTSGVR